MSNNKGLLAFGFIAPPVLWWLGSYVLAALVVVAVATIITHQFKRAYREWRLRRAHCLPEPSDELPTARLIADHNHREKILEGSMGAFTRRRSDRLAAKQAPPEPATAKGSKSREE